MYDQQEGLGPLINFNNGLIERPNENINGDKVTNRNPNNAKNNANAISMPNPTKASRSAFMQNVSKVKNKNTFDDPSSNP